MSSAKKYLLKEEETAEAVNMSLKLFEFFKSSYSVKATPNPAFHLPSNWEILDKYFPAIGKCLIRLGYVSDISTKFLRCSHIGKEK